MVGARGFEPPTSWSRTRRSTRLSHAPTNCEPLYLNPQLPHSATFYRATRVTRVTRYNSQVPRFFTFDQASRILPAVELLIRDALFLKVEYQQATNAIDAFSRKIANMGGTRVNHAEILALRDKKSSSGRRLQQTMAKIEDTGCIVKDLEAGGVIADVFEQGDLSGQRCGGEISAVQGSARGVEPSKTSVKDLS